MKYILLITVLLIVGFSACDLDRIDPETASGSKFQTAVGTNGDDFPYAVLPNADGTFIVVGSTETDNSGLMQQMYIVKIDDKGNLVDQNTFGTPRNDKATAVCAAADGGYVMVGTTINVSQPTFDVYVLKVNAQLDFSWERTIGVLDTNEFAIGIVPNGTAEFLISYYSIPFTGGTNVNTNVVRINTNGVPQSNKKILSSPALFYSMTRTSDNKLVMAGSYNDGFGITSAYLAKFNEDGSTIWDVNYPEQALSDNYGNDLVETADHNIYMTGVADFSSEPQFFVAGYSAIGMPLKDTIWGGAQEDGLSALTVSNDDQLVVTGFSKSFSGTDQAYISKRNKTSGIEIWEKISSNALGGTDIQVCPDGGFVICAVGAGASTGDIVLIKTDKDGNFQ